jgi:hypothetical protein
VYAATHLTLVYLLLTFVPQTSFPDNENLIAHLLILSLAINAAIIFLTANALCKLISPEGLQGLS